MGLFQQFPFTNLHELNLDWIIKAVKDLENHAVLSVNGETGEVVLYKSENIVFPAVDSDTWRMVRVADGHTAGVMFQNGLLYVMYDNTADRAYTINHPPAFPVTSVNGQTGAVETYADAYNQLQPVTEQNTNFYRIVDKDGSPVSVGVQVDKNKIERMHGTSRYKVYDEGNTPNLVTSINGESGAVMIAIPFADVETDHIMFQDAAAAHSWSLGRETLDGVASIQLETSANGAEVYVRFFTEDDPPVSYVRKLLTVDDIPSSSGVVSLNGLTGVVTLYGDTMPIESGAARSVKEYADDISSGLGYVELTNQATHNITAGSYVVWKGILYKANSNITIGDTLSNTNLTAVNDGGFNALSTEIKQIKHEIQYLETESAITHTINIPSGSSHYVYIRNPGKSRCWYGLIMAGGNGSVEYNEDFRGNNITVTTSTNQFIITLDVAQITNVISLNLAGDDITII